MTNEQFYKLVDDRFQYCKDLLVEKSAEYTPGNDDKLGNFVRVGQMKGTDPLDAWLGFYLKHVDSIIQMIKQIRSIRNSTHYAGLHIATDGHTVKINLINDIIDKLINEKLADNITYSLLCEAILTEVRDEHG